MSQTRSEKERSDRLSREGRLKAKGEKFDISTISSPDFDSNLDQVIKQKREDFDRELQELFNMEKAVKGTIETRFTQSDRITKAHDLLSEAVDLEKENLYKKYRQYNRDHKKWERYASRLAGFDEEIKKSRETVDSLQGTANYVNNYEKSNDEYSKQLKRTEWKKLDKKIKECKYDSEAVISDTENLIKKLKTSSNVKSSIIIDAEKNLESMKDILKDLRKNYDLYQNSCSMAKN